MASQWYFGRGADISGPVSDGELFALAAAGQVLPSDTVWREGFESGVAAAKVKYLFSDPVPTELPSPATVRGPVALPSPEPALQNPELPATPATDEPAAAESATAAAVVPRPAARSARAIAGKGTVIIGQDGKTVKFRMKCTICGKEDSSWKSIAIPRGMARSSFFCPKCRKRQDCELQGVH
jgi:hypothetical protein